jgi:hypothetical protein
LVEIGLLVLDKKNLKIFFSNVNTFKIGFSPLWPHPTPEDHDLYKLEVALYQKAFV